MSCLGDRFTGSDWFKSIMDGSGAKFTDPDFVQALGAMQELGNMGAFNTDMNSLNSDQQKTLYFNGGGRHVYGGQLGCRRSNRRA